jgi:hypothetical protein
MVWSDGIEIEKADLDAVSNLARPTCTQEVESFLGLTNLHRSFIEDYALRASALSNITGKKFVWTEAQERSFNELRDALTNPPVLGLLNTKDLFILDTGASNAAVSRVLYQQQDETERFMSRGSYALAPRKRKYGTSLQIFTDSGSNCKIKLFSSVCDLLQIHKNWTTAYRPSANGQVVRYNRTLMNAVRYFVGKNQGSWDRLLP